MVNRREDTIPISQVTCGYPFMEIHTEEYRGYAGLPPLVGLHSMQQAMTTGLTVKESVDRLKQIHWGLRRLHSIFVARIAATPIYELKMAFSLHAHYCAEHALAIANRVKEMRQPPLGLNVPPNRSFDIFFDEIAAAPDIPHLLIGLYQLAVPALRVELEQLLADTNKLFDHPTYRVCRFALPEVKDIESYGNEALRCLVPTAEIESMEAWINTLKRLQSGETADRTFSNAPVAYDGVPKRDERFKDPYNMGVNAEALLFNPDVDPKSKSIMLFFKRMREIDVPEVMSSILTENAAQPWEYQRDMTRQLWDEARHAMMGEIGFVSLGIDWTTIPLNFTWSLGLNTKLDAKERHAVLYTIEQGLMPKKNGKEYEWQVAVATANRLTALIQDYDWADEVLHARIGREWLVPAIGSQVEALAYGDEAWSRVTEDWAKWRADGLTEHRNWWPEVYRAACCHWGIEPNPELLAYNTTYEKTRADLKENKSA